MTTRYATLEQFRAAKLSAREERDAYAQKLKESWSVLKEPATRGLLLRDAMGDALRSWKPYRRLQELLGGHLSGSTVSSIGVAFASMQGGLGKRLLYLGISMLLGKLIGDQEEKGPGLLSTLASAIGSMRTRIRERKAQREAEESEAGASNRD